MFRSSGGRRRRGELMELFFALGQQSADALLHRTLLSGRLTLLQGGELE
jgi:hypothetical protein